MFESFDKDEVFLYDLQISDVFDGMMNVGDYLQSESYCIYRVLFIAKCLSVFANNGWEQQDIASLKIIGFPLSVIDHGSSHTKKAVLLKQSNDDTTLMLSEMKLPEYYDRYLIIDPKIPDSCYKYFSIMRNILPESKNKCQPGLVQF